MSIILCNRIEILDYIKRMDVRIWFVSKSLANNHFQIRIIIIIESHSVSCNLMSSPGKLFNLFGTNESTIY